MVVRVLGWLSGCWDGHLVTAWTAMQQLLSKNKGTGSAATTTTGTGNGYAAEDNIIIYIIIYTCTLFNQRSHCTDACMLLMIGINTVTRMNFVGK